MVAIRESYGNYYIPFLTETFRNVGRTFRDTRVMYDVAFPLDLAARHINTKTSSSVHDPYQNYVELLKVRALTNRMKPKEAQIQAANCG